MAVGALVAVFFDPSGLSDRVLNHLWQVIALITGTGGVGAYLSTADRQERVNIERQQLLDRLLEMPEGKQRDKRIDELIQKMISGAK